METAVAHGIGVKNRYALFYNDDVDPLEILKQQEEEKLKRKTDKAQGKDKAKNTKSTKQTTTTVSPKKPESLPAKNVKVSEVPNKSKGKAFNDQALKSNENFPDTKVEEDRKNFRNRGDQAFEVKERDGEFRRGRGGFRGRGGRERGRGYFGNPDGRNRRPFDRHSGSDKTGVRPVDKRDGAGANNWGDIKSDINRKKEDAWDEEEFDSGDKPNDSLNSDEGDQERKIENVDAPVKSEDEVATENEAKEADKAEETQIEKTVKEMTLDEWKREQEAKRAVPKYNLRKPGEGEDDKQWKKLYVLKKKTKDDEEEEEEDDEIDEEYGRKGQQRQLLDIQINFSGSRRGRGRGRGGRGGGRGRDFGNRDGPRDDFGRDRSFGQDSQKMKKSQQSAPCVDDWNDFPSLVKA